MTLTRWVWLFLILYILLMLGLGLLARTRVKSADDYATARGSYGPLVLALAFAATVSVNSASQGLRVAAVSAVVGSV